MPVLNASPYVGYAYAYPHKTAYRPLTPPLPLGEVWAAERRDALFLYLHVPFCEMRCGFCNLFTTANPHKSLVSAYLAALRRQAERVRDAVSPVTIAQMAIGGGTPTYLDTADLDALFQIAADCFDADPSCIPASVETSPRTAEPAKLRLLRARGVDRISIGVQSFCETETAAAGRAQRTTWVEQALETIRDLGLPTLNIDLIYGLPGQTTASWLHSLEAALRFAPEELYLYPLYVRPLTGLDGRATWEDDPRLACYRAARDRLLAIGYEQMSMRMFRRPTTSATGRRGDGATGRLLRRGDGASREPGAGSREPGAGHRAPGTAYCCQEDGMLGIGCGARSYTRGLQYATEYAVAASGVREILAEYVRRPAEAFGVAEYGFVLDAEEQRRRYVIQSLLQVEGLSLPAYRNRFESDVFEDLPQLRELFDHGLATAGGHRLRLTDAGIERSDAIGPWLYSARVCRLMAEYDLR